MNTPRVDALYNSDFHRWDGEDPDAAYHRMTDLARELEVELNESEAAESRIAYQNENLANLYGARCNASERLERERDELERERGNLEFAIKNALHELWGSPAQTFQARQILREALGQPQGQIDNEPPRTESPRS
jgi:hypothetical protein